MIRWEWIVVVSLFGILEAREEVCARSLRSWLGLEKTHAPQNPPSEQEKDPAPEQTESQPQTPSEKKTNPTRPPSSPRSDSSKISTPAFMTPPKDLSDSWQNYAEQSPSLALQGLVYIRDDQWTVWLNGNVLLPTLRSLSVGDQTVQITMVTPRSVTIQCPNEAITLTVGQTYDLRTHQLSIR